MPVSRWLAREALLHDPALVGFWPLVQDGRDHSGRRAHLLHPSESYASLAIDLGGRRGFLAGRYRKVLSAPVARLPNLLQTLDPADPQARGFTVSLWLRLGDDGAVQGLLGQRRSSSGGQGSGWSLTGAGASYQFEVARSHDERDGAYFSLPGALGRWVHLAFRVRVAQTETGSDQAYPSRLVIDIFLDGRAHQPTAAVHTLAGPLDYAAADPLVLGGISANGTVLDSVSALSLVRLYSRPLSSIDVAELFRRESAAFGRDRVPPRVPLSGSARFFVGSSSLVAATLPLAAPGGRPGEWGFSRLAVVGGPPQAQLALPLSVAGRDSAGAPLPLFAGSSSPAALAAPLFVGSSSAAAASLPLSVVGVRVAASRLGLFCAGGAADWPGPPAGLPAAAAFGLSVEASPAPDPVGTPASAGLGLTLRGESSGTATAPLSLFAGGSAHPAAGSVPLLLRGPGAWVSWWGPGVWDTETLLWQDYAATESAGRTLGFALKGERFERAEAPLALFVGNTPPAGVALFVQGATSAAGPLPLSVGGASVAAGSALFALPSTSAPAAGSVPLYTNGW